MYLHHRAGLIWLASLASIAVSATTASAQFETGFEQPEYVSGGLEFQDDWEPFGSNYPRVRTAAEIAQELEDADLNPANPVHGGDQAMLMTHNLGETDGGFMRRRFTGLEEERFVVMEWWARSLTPGSDGSTVGFNLGNTFVGIQDDVDGGDAGRAAALRFGFHGDEGQEIQSIDFASNTGSDIHAVWVPSGILWEADTWYNFQFHLDYEDKVYDLYINGAKANDDPITFYRPTSKFAATVFVSRGTNQAGQIIDDMSVAAEAVPVPGDYNNDGEVDAADYTVWRDNVGAPAGTLPNDTDGGVIGQAQYNTWVANFGMTSDSGSGGAAAAVPEPTSLALLLCVAVLFSARRLGRRWS